MKELVSILLLWISSHSQLVYEGSNLPEVIQVSKKELVNEMYEGNPPFALNINRISAIGLYNFKKGNIYLLDSLDLDTTKGRSFLLHEVVHFLQYELGIEKKFSCKNQLEPLAYKLQAKYLIENGESFNISNRHIDRVSTCS